MALPFIFSVNIYIATAEPLQLTTPPHLIIMVSGKYRIPGFPTM